MENIINEMTTAELIAAIRLWKDKDKLIGTNFDHDYAIKYATEVLRQRNRNAFESRKDLY